MAFPVVTIKRSSLLDGQHNGQLEKDILWATPGQAKGATVVLVKPAARAWRALCAAALRDGHTLKATSVADSYRLYEIQERIFRERYTTTFLRGRPSRVWMGRRWYQKPGTAVAAVPGTSNHGWAQAVDVGEERDSDVGAESLDDPTLSWLLVNEHLYGWSHEVQSEPWHLHYFAGDTLPAAVLAYEKSLHTDAPPTALAEDDIMFTYNRPSGRLVQVVGSPKPGAGRQILLTGASIQARRDKAIETHLGKVDQDEADRYDGLYGPVVD